MRAPTSRERVSGKIFLPFPGFLEIDESPGKGRKFRNLGRSQKIQRDATRYTNLPKIGREKICFLVDMVTLPAERKCWGYLKGYNSMTFCKQFFFKKKNNLFVLVIVGM